MPPAEQLSTAAGRVIEQEAGGEPVTGWGGGRPAFVTRWRGAGSEALIEAIASGSLGRAGTRHGVITRGLGRSYGDAAQCDGGSVIDGRVLRGITLDATTGSVTAGGGVSLRELLAAVISAGWILPVVPGTQHVTVGGAIAADIHGKNHGTALTFSRHVLSLGLLTSTGTVLELAGAGANGDDDERFAATTGGMGLTGVILWARIQLRRVRSAMLAVDTDRATDLDQVLSLLDTGGAGAHRVAWLDLLAGPEPRGVVTRADHLEQGDGSLIPANVTTTARLAVPSGWPAGLLRASSVRAHNELRFRLAPRREHDRPQAFAAHMFPLDVLGAWPRLYGPRGLRQYQFVVPRGAERTIREVLSRLRSARIPCFLAVLKDFGAAAPGPLSFPIAGWTLALDLPSAAVGLDAALDGCDAAVAAAGGRVYLAKDATLRPDSLRAMYPRLSEWQRVRDELDPGGLWRSDLAVRTGLVDAGGPTS